MIKYEYLENSKLVNAVDELCICKCGRPNETYKLIHNIMKEISENGVRTDQTAYYDFIIYQLNKMEFLEHGTSIYGSWITKKGHELIEGLNEMEKYDYEYEDFYKSHRRRNKYQVEEEAQ